MLEILFIMLFHPMMLALACPPASNSNLIITHLNANQLPYNTTLPYNGSAYYWPCLISQNSPWFWPLVTLALMLYGDFVFAIKKGVDTKLNFAAVAASFTILSYIEVLGNLTTSSTFFLFEFIMLIALFMMTLFGSNKA